MEDASPLVTQAEEQDATGNETMSKARKAEMLALEAVELVPEDPRPWQALAEACDAQGEAHVLFFF